ncbi:MAG: hypothetical protein Q9M37_09415 [Desulfonauticus sp.]|nr:hypothetical protein [Desulfonauticus sp.]
MLMIKAVLFSCPISGSSFISLMLGTSFGFFVFSKLFARIVAKNISRIHQKQPACIFAFQSVKSYLIIAFMITLGITIRHFYPNKIALGFIYSAVGISLLKSSFIYFGEYITNKN